MFSVFSTTITPVIFIFHFSFPLNHIYSYYHSIIDLIVDQFLSSSRLRSLLSTIWFTNKTQMKFIIHQFLITPLISVVVVTFDYTLIDHTLRKDLTVQYTGEAFDTLISV